MRWFAAVEAIASQPVAALLVDAQKTYRQRGQAALFQQLLGALAQPQYAGGLRRLLPWICWRARAVVCCASFGSWQRRCVPTRRSRRRQWPNRQQSHLTQRGAPCPIWCERARAI
jgi:hypothetical protein